MANIGATTALYKVETALTRQIQKLAKYGAFVLVGQVKCWNDLLMLLWETHSALITLEQSQL